MIKINNVVKKFTTGTKEFTVLDNISLEIAKGEIVGIIGISGAGKSTLLRCIGGLEVPSSGTIEVDNKNIADLDAKQKIEYYKSLGTIFQGYNLMMQQTVAKNIALPLEINRVNKAEIEVKVNTLLTLVGLEDKAKEYPARLSGGQKQRVAIARALANNPKLLLCDEPTSALDCLTTRAILDLLKKINAELGITIVIITHDIEVVESICDKVIVLDKSNLVEQGLVTEVLSLPQADITKQFLGKEAHQW
ncbi:MAG: ABC transporter [Epulopiscium sp. Nele67-Bin001]|nr:MAG: ABC transporter [Epulopiscium sp. Nuni2H_MBin001]OON92352.1 MAG: ABC transporter [Epulopiscium sp. Nele67-Bin001]